ncbi:MAG: hypothetical protein ACYC27_08265 [Armatimonadota bacterium]
MKKYCIVLLFLLAVTNLLCAQNAGAQSDSQNTVTISRSEFDELKSKVLILESELEKLKNGGNSASTSENGSEVKPDTSTVEESDSNASSETEPAPSQQAGGRQLELPDISLVVQSKGKLSTDKRDEGRDRLRLSEAELSIQGFVYPNVKADAYLAVSPEEGEPMQVEEAYLTYLGLKNNLNIYLGKKHVPFGRTNLMHNHSWLYARQPLVISNLVAEESLAGEGIDVSYLIPTKSNLFAQLDLGTWTGEGPGESSDLPDIVSGPGASFADRFSTARLWASYPINDYNELELGASYAKGSSEGLVFEDSGDVTLTGIDLSYRRFMEGNRRLLLRGETISRKEKAGFNSSKVDGYYLFGNYKPSKYSSIGLLYDWSSFPQSPDLHETALSLILTKQFSERYYIRFQGTHGSRPGDNSYNEMLLQWVWGVGPHTHNLD